MSSVDAFPDFLKGIYHHPCSAVGPKLSRFHVFRRVPFSLAFCFSSEASEPENDIWLLDVPRASTTNFEPPCQRRSNGDDDLLPHPVYAGKRFAEAGFAYHVTVNISPVEERIARSKGGDVRRDSDLHVGVIHVLRVPDVQTPHVAE